MWNLKWPKALLAPTEYKSGSGTCPHMSCPTKANRSACIRACVCAGSGMEAGRISLCPLFFFHNIQFSGMIFLYPRCIYCCLQQATWKGAGGEQWLLVQSLHPLWERTDTTSTGMSHPRGRSRWGAWHCCTSEPSEGPATAPGEAHKKHGSA